MSASIPSQLFPSISRVLSTLQSGDVDQFPKRKKIEEIVAESRVEIGVVLSVLSILAILGFVDVGDDEDVMISSKYPNIAISALRERLDLSVPVLYNLRDVDKKRYFREFTKSLEIIRNGYHGGNIPIHNREIVNLIIKGRQIKNWKYQDVFLHVYHPDWDQYHLVGIGKRGEGSIDELAHKAMRQRLHLEPIDYELDPNTHPPPIEYIAISRSQGALTFYTINTRVINKFNLDLNEYLEKKIFEKREFTIKTFRWFTLKEVNQRDVVDASIMESTPRVLNGLDVSRIPVSVRKAKHFGIKPLLDIKVFSDLPNRLDLGRAISYFSAILVTLIVLNIGRFLNVQLYWLDNLNSIASIISGIISLWLLITGIKEST